MKDELFGMDGQVEEFVLQTIAINNGDMFYDIGNECCTNDPIGTNSPDGSVFKFMYKTNREGLLFTPSVSFVSCVRQIV